MGKCKVVTLENLDTVSDDEYEMTKEDKKLYSSQVRDSEGFDVDDFPGVIMFHQIYPVILDIDEDNTETVISYAKAAIQEYNKRDFKQKTEGELEYHELLMATHQLKYGFMFRLTFNAKNLDKEGEIQTYQAILLTGVKEEPEVLSFRPKPSGSEKKWYWHDDDCDP